MKNFLLILAAVVIALGVRNFVLPQKAATVAPAESAYDRVIRTRVLHCAYAVYPPFLGKDPNSGKLSGIMPDVMDAFAQASGLKVEWGPEVDWGAIAATLQAGKADAFCAGMYITPQRGLVIADSTPIYFGVLNAYARTDDKRFDDNLDAMNRPDVSMSVNMGDASEEVSKRLFPQAQLVYRSLTGGEAELFLNVANHKADLTLSGPNNLSTFNQSNPDMALRQVPLEHPLMVFPSVISVDIHEQMLRSLLNVTLHSLIDSGEVDRILRADTGEDYGVSYFPAKSQLN